MKLALPAQHKQSKHAQRVGSVPQQESRRYYNTEHQLTFTEYSMAASCHTRV